MHKFIRFEKKATQISWAIKFTHIIHAMSACMTKFSIITCHFTIKVLAHYTTPTCAEHHTIILYTGALSTVHSYCLHGQTGLTLYPKIS